MTLSREVIERALDRRAEDEPAILGLMHKAAKDLRGGRYNSDGWQNIIGQKPRGADIYDAYAFSETWGLLLTGELLTVQIQLRGKPGKDSAEDWNNKILSHIPHPFKAFFEGGWGDNDGTLSWGEEIKLYRHTYDSIEEVNVDTWPHRAPLEVGYTEFCKTNFHLHESGCVARWPYGSNWMTLLWIDRDSNFWKHRMNALSSRFSNSD